MTQAPAGPADPRPLEGRDEMEALAGNPTHWQPVTSRPGCQVWRVSGPQGAWAYKIGRLGGAAVVARETAAVRRIAGTAAAAAHAQRARGGRGEHYAWLATPWLDGSSLWEAFQPVRDQADGRDGPLSAAAEAATILGGLHQARWIHGSLGPRHIILTREGARFVDWAWSWHSLPPSTHFTGGLVHLSAPEVLAQAASGQRPVTTSQPDEVWTLAASLWWAATGQWPRNYAAIGVDPAKHTTAELTALLLHTPAPLGRITYWPDLEDALRTVLTTVPARRPTALQLADILRQIRC
ncbi:hypothetical protein J3S85_33665 [Streptomyces lavenduligriseus]|nr:hypothetical protein J3S85_33665 [Streptomyces lavenduligriseus]